MTGSRILLAGLAALALTLAASARAADFYAGKTITFLVGVAAGGSSDLGCRMVAGHMAAHIAGQPNIIVKNMPSPTGAVAVNYVGKQARNDGLTLICGVFGVDLQLSGDKSLEVDLTKFNYIAGDAQTQVFYVRSDVPPGIRTAQDVFMARGLIYGGQAVNSLKDVPGRLFLEIAGIKDYKYVTGFPGDSQGRAAVQQNFINLWMEGTQSYAKVTAATMAKSGEVVPLFQSGLLDDQGALTHRSDLVPDLPTFIEFYRARYGKPPAGRQWEFLSALLANWAVAFHGIMLPPGAPPAAVAALRAAVAPMNRDPDFIADAENMMGKGAREAEGAVVAAKVKELLDLPPAVKAVYTETVQSGQALAGSK